MCRWDKRNGVRVQFKEEKVGIGGVYCECVSPSRREWLFWFPLGADHTCLRRGYCLGNRSGGGKSIGDGVEVDPL